MKFPVLLRCAATAQFCISKRGLRFPSYQWDTDATSAWNSSALALLRSWFGPIWWYLLIYSAMHLAVMQCQGAEFPWICMDIIINITFSNKGQYPHAIGWRGVRRRFVCMCVVDLCVAVRSAGGLTRVKPKYHCGNAHGHGGWNIKKRNRSEVMSKPLNIIILHSWRLLQHYVVKDVKSFLLFICRKGRFSSYRANGSMK